MLLAVVAAACWLRPAASALVLPRAPLRSPLRRAAIIASNNYGGEAEETVTSRRKFSSASKRRFEQMEEQALREPADRTAGKIVGAGLILGLVGSLAFAALNGYIRTG